MGKKTKIKGIAIVFLLIQQILSNDWQLLNPNLTGSALNDVFFVTPNKGWAVGENGTILHTEDSGNSWVIQSTPMAFPAPFKSVAFYNEMVGFGVGGVFGRTYAVKTEDGGDTWTDVSYEFPPGGILKVAFNGDKIWVSLWKGPPNNIAVKSINDTTWTYPNIISKGLINDIAFKDNLNGIICGDGSFLAATKNGGQDWIVSEENFNAIFHKLFVTTNKVFALGIRGQLVETENMGDSWTLLYESFMGQFNELFFMNTNDLYNGYITSSYGPTSFIKFDNISKNTLPEVVASNIFPQITSLYPINEMENIAVCWNGAIHKIFDLADSSMEITSNTGNNIRLIDFFDSENGIALSRESEYFKTKNSGLTWQKANLPSNDLITGMINFQNGKSIIRTATQTLTSLDFGDTWSESQNNDFDTDIYQKIPTISTSAVSVKSNYLIYTNNAGESWEIRGLIQFGDVKPNDFISDLFFWNEMEGWALSKYGAVVQTFDGGQSWVSKSGIPEEIIANNIFFLDSLKGWVGGYIGDPRVPLIFFTTDGGETWNRHSNMNFHTNLALPTDVEFGASILKIVGLSDSSLWALSDVGILFSNDGGKNWYHQTLPEYGKIFTDLFQFENGTVFVTGDNARIWKGTGGPGELTHLIMENSIIQNQMLKGKQFNVLGIELNKKRKSNFINFQIK